jgi:hypothetical protein
MALAMHLRPWEGIPFRATPSSNEDHFAGFAVVPMRYSVSSIADVRASLSELTRHLEMMKAYAPDPASQQKYANTLRWLQNVDSNWAGFGD